MTNSSGKTPHRRWIRTGFMIGLSVLAIGFVFRLSEAGSLTPSAPPAGTMYALSSVFAPLASTAYDSSAVVASMSGNALQVTKCIINKITGGTPCP